VAARHVVVQGVDGGVQSHISVLAIHVVCAGARVVLDPDAVVLSRG
jgi:hypothetical protein